MADIDDWLTGVMTLEATTWNYGAVPRDALLALGPTVIPRMLAASSALAGDDQYVNPAQRRHHTAQRIRIQFEDLVHRYTNDATDETYGVAAGNFTKINNLMTDIETALALLGGTDQWVRLGAGEDGAGIDATSDIGTDATVEVV